MNGDILAGIFLLAFLCEYIDSSLGMGYGTIISPVLILAGFDPLIIIPSILISQALSGLAATCYHQRHRNFDLLKNKRDAKTFFVIVVAGLIATLFAIMLTVNMPEDLVKVYIGVLVLVMGAILLSGVKFVFSWKKIIVVGVLSAFNKAMTGAGFGPIVTSGQIASGRKARSAVGVATATKVPICVTSFIVYYLLTGTSEISIPITMTVGALLAAPLGPIATSKLKKRQAVIIVGTLTLALGIFTLGKTYFESFV